MRKANKGTANKLVIASSRHFLARFNSNKQKIEIIKVQKHKKYT